MEGVRRNLFSFPVKFQFTAKFSEFKVFLFGFRLDGGHVVFGQVADKTSKDIVKRVEGFGSKGGNPKAKLVIDRCHCNH